MSRGVCAPNAEAPFNSAVNGFEDFTAASTTYNTVDLSESTDVLLTVTVPPGALTGTTPTITARLEGVARAGNPIPPIVRPRPPAPRAVGSPVLHGLTRIAGRVPELSARAYPCIEEGVEVREATWGTTL